MLTFDPNQLKALILEHYAAKLHHLPGEIGTCKKVLQIGPAFEAPIYDKIGLAVTRYCQPKDKEMIENEHNYLGFLKDKGYPVISLHGKVFEITASSGKVHHAMLMDYVENATFIEAKTPASLNLMILAALLNIKTCPQEAWLALNKISLCEEIRKQLQISSVFDLLRQRALALQQNFMTLIEKLSKDTLAIGDLQILITKEGGLTIIDPLDVVLFNPKEPAVTPLFPSNKETKDEFISFLLDTQKWLENAQALCANLAQAKSFLEIEKFICLNTQDKELFFSMSDPRRKSRVSQLRALASSPPPFIQEFNSSRCKHT